MTEEEKTYIMTAERRVGETTNSLMIRKVSPMVRPYATTISESVRPRLVLNFRAYIVRLWRGDHVNLPPAR